MLDYFKISTLKLRGKHKYNFLDMCIRLTYNKTYCDEATDNNETVIVTLKDEKNVVILSLEKYNQMMKAAKNAEYLAMIDRGIAQLSSGRGTAT